MKPIAIIPARGGSTRIKGKNIRAFHGKPIIAYSIEAAHNSGCFERIFVSTDDPAIAAVAKAYGAKIHQRSRAMSQNEVGTQEVAQDALRSLISGLKEPPKYACVIYPTAPLMLPKDLQAGFELLAERPDNPRAFHYVYTAGQDGADAGQWYWGWVDAFLTARPLHSNPPNSLRYILPAERVCDVNFEADWQRAEVLYRNLKEEPMHVHDHKLVASPDPKVPELTHFRCDCGHSLPT